MKNRWRIPFSIFLLAALASASIRDGDEEENFIVIRASPNTTDQLAFVRDLHDNMHEYDLDFWLTPHGVGHMADMMVRESRLPWLRDQLGEKGISNFVSVPDVRKLILDREHKSKPNKFTQMLEGFKKRYRDEGGNKAKYGFGDYHSYDTITEWMHEIERLYPDRAKVMSIGETEEKRQIKTIKLGTSIGTTDRRVIWIDGGIHAREWAAVHTVIYFIDRLIADYDSDPLVREAMDNTHFYITPVLNPDGYEFSRTGVSPMIRLWRKNRSNMVCKKDRWFRDRCCGGVDLNRNFDWFWGEIGSSADRCSEIYAGTSVWSEAESRAVRDMMFSPELRGKVDAFITIHTYSQMWIHPFSHQRKTVPEDIAETEEVGRRAVAALEGMYGTKFRFGTGADMLYPSSGGSDDWAKGKGGAKFVYLLELRPGEEVWDGFILDSRQLMPTAKETWAGVKVVIDAVLKRNRRAPLGPGKTNVPQEAVEKSAALKSLLIDVFRELLLDPNRVKFVEKTEFVDKNAREIGWKAVEVTSSLEIGGDEVKVDSEGVHKAMTASPEENEASQFGTSEATTTNGPKDSEASEGNFEDVTTVSTTRKTENHQKSSDDLSKPSASESDRQGIDQGSEGKIDQTTSFLTKPQSAKPSELKLEGKLTTISPRMIDKGTPLASETVISEEFSSTSVPTSSSLSSEETTTSTSETTTSRPLALPLVATEKEDHPAKPSEVSDDKSTTLEKFEEDGIQFTFEASENPSVDQLEVPPAVLVVEEERNDSEETDDLLASTIPTVTLSVASEKVSDKMGDKMGKTKSGEDKGSAKVLDINEAEKVDLGLVGEIKNPKEDQEATPTTIEPTEDGLLRSSPSLGPPTAISATPSASEDQTESAKSHKKTTTLPRSQAPTEAEVTSSPLEATSEAGVIDSTPPVLKQASQKPMIEATSTVPLISSSSSSSSADFSSTVSRLKITVASDLPQRSSESQEANLTKLDDFGLTTIQPSSHLPVAPAVLQKPKSTSRRPSKPRKLPNRVTVPSPVLKSTLRPVVPRRKFRTRHFLVPTTRVITTAAPTTTAWTTAAPTTTTTEATTTTAWVAATKPARIEVVRSRIGMRRNRTRPVLMNQEATRVLLAERFRQQQARLGQEQQRRRGQGQSMRVVSGNVENNREQQRPQPPPTAPTFQQPQAQGLCIDRSPWCGAWIHGNPSICQISSIYMRRDCARSCRYCT